MDENTKKQNLLTKLWAGEFDFNTNVSLDNTALFNIALAVFVGGFLVVLANYAFKKLG